ncbi:MAG: metallophosphoesterase family protein [Anaeroplasmataceae bacterium]
MKILIISDIHIGSRNDIKDYYEKELVTIIDTLHKKKIDTIVIAGDLFDKRISTNSDFNTYANLFINGLAKYCRENDATLFIVKGTMSHDFYQLDSFLYLTKEPKNNTYIINTCQEIFYKNSTLLFIPEEYESSKEEYYKDTIYNPEKKYDMVFGHGMFTFAGGYVTESGKHNHIVFNTNDFANNVHGLVVFGHIHTKMSKDNCRYPGSFSRDSFGEEESKGSLFIDYDVNKKKVIKEEFIKNDNAPLFISINANETPDENVGVFIAEKLKTCNRLRIVIDSDITETKYNDLKAIAYDNKSLVLYKRMRGLSKKEDDDKNKELEDRRKERRDMIEKYVNMDFFEITKSYAKDKFDVEFSIDEIKESIT